MSDSSSVDRWHPSNVEWPKHKDGTPNRTIGPTNPAFLTGYYRPGKGPEVVPLAAYEALYADRGRVLAAARELAEAVEEMMNASAEDDQGARIGAGSDGPCVGLVTVELTREEAEHAMARGEHPSNAPMTPDFSCPDCKRIAAKFRASLERTGK